jgi:uncharacterized protein YaeQ
MALKATIFKVELIIADMERNYYHDHTLTIARHPSETDERMMVRLLAFALHADEALTFGKGLSSEDEPDLWQKDLTGAIELWIDVGLPDQRAVRKACGRAKQVCVYSYGGRTADLWWQQCSDKLQRLENLAVINLLPESTHALARLARRNMRLDCTIQDGQIWLGDTDERVSVEAVCLKKYAASQGMRE